MLRHQAATFVIKTAILAIGDNNKTMTGIGLVPIVVGRNGGNAGAGSDGNYPGYSGYGYVAPIGYNNRGVDEMERIIMSLKSGIEGEVSWALNTLTRLSSHSNVDLNNLPFVGNELIRYFIQPFHFIIEQQLDKFNQENLTLSLDCLLSLRNLAQDLHNQQWLSQIKSLKKYLIEVLRFLTNWFYQNIKIYSLIQYENQFFEALRYLLDLLEPLSCYYIDNTKNDPLFNILLSCSILTNDKAIFISIIKSLSHLLIIKSKPENGKKSDNNNANFDNANNTNSNNGEDDDIESLPNNCIDNINQIHLQFYVDHLLINDNEINYSVLQFLKQYLFSQALHPSYPNSIKDSQTHRLLYLLQINNSKACLNTLVKQLPVLIISNLPLNDLTNLRNIPQLNLTKRSQFSGVPSTLPELPDDLYKIIIRFPEPLRATTWLRCCYEPYIHHPSSQIITSSENSDVIPGEVTQISLWKAYERQFQEIWQPVNGNLPNNKYKPLLPAVDFIKNVTHAFPNSEAMVVNLEPVDDQPKKKFIIKGIQPRQFAVNLDVGNYEALKPATISSTNPSQNYKLPIGHIDYDKFKHSLNSISESIINESSTILKDREVVSPINLISNELLDYIITEIYENNEKLVEENLLKFYTKHWLPDLIYANPSLIETGLINGKWLKYII
jgi:chromatin structure-remodeling complex subunit RSC9